MANGYKIVTQSLFKKSSNGKCQSWNFNCDQTDCILWNCTKFENFACQIEK
jgi:hypothetical protein